MNVPHPIAMTIAGSDSGGGAGIQADLKTFTAFGCYGTSAVTAVTVQNTLKVGSVHHVPADIVRDQLAALGEDLPPAAFKTGMLGNHEIASIVAASIRQFQWLHYVLDPVLSASLGGALLDDQGMEILRTQLVPLAECVTPNLDEAERLTGMSVRDPEEMRRAGEAIVALGAHAALIKGGHLEGPELIDVLVTREGSKQFHHPRLDSRNTHGTGCTLSAAICAGLAWGVPLEDAISDAIQFLQEAILEAPGIGKGIGPLWHGVR